MAISSVRLGTNHELVMLVSASTLCFGLTVVRVFLSDSNMYLFLNWNLFLAVIPYAASRMVFKLKKNSGRRLLIVLLFTVWLVFFPNAPYIITDIIHLRYSDRSFLWYDILLVFMFAWLGLIYGIISLLNIERAYEIEKKYKRTHLLFAPLFLFLASYGIYLGRFLRWNSWDIIRNPLLLLTDIFNTIIHPRQYIEAWAITGFLSILLTIIYFTSKYLIHQPYAYFKTIKQLD